MINVRGFKSLVYKDLKVNKAHFYEKKLLKCQILKNWLDWKNDFEV